MKIKTRHGEVEVITFFEDENERTIVLMLEE
jgi:hypothetical protein